MEHVIIGVDPHKLSATIEVVDHHEKLLGLGRFTTDRAGYAAMRKHVVQWPDRVWAVEGSIPNTAGRNDRDDAGCADTPPRTSATVRRRWRCLVEAP